MLWLIHPLDSSDTLHLEWKANRRFSSRFSLLVSRFSLIKHLGECSFCHSWRQRAASSLVEHLMFRGFFLLALKMFRYLYQFWNRKHIIFEKREEMAHFTHEYSFSNTYASLPDKKNTKSFQRKITIKLLHFMDWTCFPLELYPRISFSVLRNIFTAFVWKATSSNSHLHWINSLWLNVFVPFTTSQNDLIVSVLLLRLFVLHVNTWQSLPRKLETFENNPFLGTARVSCTERWISSQVAPALPTSCSPFKYMSLLRMPIPVPTYTWATSG